MVKIVKSVYIYGSYRKIKTELSLFGPPCITVHVCNCFTAKVSVSNFKAENSENMDNAFYVFTFFWMTLQKI